MYVKILDWVKLNKRLAFGLILSSAFVYGLASNVPHAIAM